MKSELSRVYSDGSVNLTAASLLWALHHSLLDASKGDGIIIGASTIQQLDENLTACNKPPLHPDIIKAFDLAWESVKETCPPYYR